MREWSFIAVKMPHEARAVLRQVPAASACLRRTWLCSKTFPAIMTWVWIPMVNRGSRACYKHVSHCPVVCAFWLGGLPTCRLHSTRKIFAGVTFWWQQTVTGFPRGIPGCVLLWSAALAAPQHSAVEWVSNHSQLMQVHWNVAGLVSSVCKAAS